MNESDGGILAIYLRSYTNCSTTTAVNYAITYLYQFIFYPNQAIVRPLVREYTPFLATFPEKFYAIGS